MQDLGTSESERPESENASVESQPIRVVERHGARFTLLGTAHVSKASAQEVERLIDSGEFEAVAVELDKNRYAAITDPDRWSRTNLFEVIRQGKAGMVAANLALGAFQQRLADQLGIEPGQEMRVAIRAARAAGLPVLLIDRDIGITLRRVYRSVPWWRRFTLLAGLLASVMSNEKITEQDIEKLKEGDMLEATFTEFAESSKSLYQPLIAERDHYMAIRLQEEAAKHPKADPEEAARAPRNILVVIGAGHLRGITTALEGDPEQDPRQVRQELERLPPPSVMPKLIPWVIVALIIVGFVLGFLRSPGLGLQLIGDWFLINGILAALGALLALGHPLTIAGVFLAAPLTSLNPLIGAGFVAAGIELWLRKPNVGDFGSLRKDVTTVRGWWRNRVARTLLVFFFSTLGSAAGTYLAGFRIFGRLLG